MACVTGYLEMVDAQYFLKNLLTLKIFHYLQHHSLFNIFFILHKSCMSEGKRKFWTNLNISSTQHFSQLIFEIMPLYPHTLHPFIYLPHYFYLLYLLPFTHSEHLHCLSLEGIYYTIWPVFLELYVI